MVSVVLLMAGKGSRMKEDKNKILLPLNGIPLYEYPLQAFLKFDLEIICVLSKEDENEIAPKLPKCVKYTFGGATRQESVYNGLKLCRGDFVIIHDAARALVSKDIIQTIIENSNKKEAILVYLPVKDTIKQNQNGKISTLLRSELIAAATPQCAPLSVLIEAYQNALRDSFVATDDISLLEKYFPNLKIHLIPSNEENFKITTPLDYKLAKLIVEEKL